jgi:hypothetical protein
MNMSRLIPVLFFGTIWGLSEVILGNYFYAQEIKSAAVILNVIAIAILAFSRFYVSFPGAAFLIGTIAMLFKIFHSPFFACHMLAIGIFGAGFEIAAFLFLRGESAGLIRKALTGASAVYIGFALFAVVITFVIRYEYWMIDGSANMPKVLGYVFLAGSIVAAIAAVLTPLGLWAAEKTQTLAENKSFLKPAYVNVAMVLAAISLWIVI